MKRLAFAVIVAAFLAGPGRAQNITKAARLTPAEIAAGTPMPDPYQPKIRPVRDRKFDALAVASFSSAVADMSLTRACLSAHTCREGNPLMRSTPAALAFGIGLPLVGNVMAYEAKKDHRRHWCAPQVTTIAAHTVGIISGLRVAR
jgi:hypothetical protein